MGGEGCLLRGGGASVIALSASESLAAQVAWGTGAYANGTPWAPNAATNLANANAWNATAAIGVDPPNIETWGPAIQFNLTSGQSYSSVSYVPSNNTAPLNRTYNAASPATLCTPSSYMGNSNYTTSTVGQYYPDAPTAGTQPGAPATGNPTLPAVTPPGVNNGTTMNVNTTMSFPVASRVTSNASGTNQYSDPYYGSSINPSRATPSLYQPGTTAAIIAGNYVPDGTGNPLTMQWRTRTPNEMLTQTGSYWNLPNTAAYLASDAVQLSGQRVGTDFVMEMDFSNQQEKPDDQMYDIMANKGLYLGILGNINDQTQWINAVYYNSQSEVKGPVHIVNGKPTQASEYQPAVGAYAWNPSAQTGTFSKNTVSSQPYLGSFQSFLNSTYIEDGQVHYFYEHSLDELRSTWGVNTSTDTAWAVLDVGSNIFAVVPEPATIRLMAAGLLTAGIGVWWRRRVRIKAAKKTKAAAMCPRRCIEARSASERKSRRSPTGHPHAGQRDWQIHASLARRAPSISIRARHSIASMPPAEFAVGCLFPVCSAVPKTRVGRCRRRGSGSYSQVDWCSGT